MGLCAQNGQLRQLRKNRCDLPDGLCCKQDLDMAGILPVDPAGLFLGSRIELTLDRYGTVGVAHDQTRVPLEAEKQMKIYRCR